MAAKTMKGKFTLSEIKKHVLTAISYLLPLIVASGLLIAIGNLTGGSEMESLADLTVPSMMTSIGVMGMGLIPAFIAGYIAYSVADRPGLAPGFLMGMVASFLNTGFLGGLIGGLVAGYIALAIEVYVGPHVPKWAQALMPMMIVPTVATLLAGLIMYFVLGGPLTWFTEALTNFIVNLDQSQKLAYGFILGFIQHLDYGGAISKVPNLICDGMMADGIYGPEAVKVLGSMVPPFGVTIALLISKAIKRPIFKYSEEENIKVAFPMGVCMITEGVIPIAMNDLVRTVFCTAMGDAVCGAIAFSMGVESMVPSGGVFVIPAMTNPLWAVIALLVGSCVTGLLLVLLKKPLKPEEIDDLGHEEAEEQEVDLSGFSLS
ncbi:PTS fructose transporter subunit IIC [Enorma massiliensis]|uniref:PTS fructose transporter subunit IIC n=1 Tax=Enorma massiliensis TaxID=1472761 RepID=UPI003A949BC5